MIVPVMAISNLVLTRQIYSEETNGAHAHSREPVPITYVERHRQRLPRDNYDYSNKSMLPIVHFVWLLYRGTTKSTEQSTS